MQTVYYLQNEIVDKYSSLHSFNRIQLRKDFNKRKNKQILTLFSLFRPALAEI